MKMWREVVKVLCVAALVAVMLPAHRATATSKSIAILRSPAALLTLVAATVTAVPGSGWCSVMVRNHTALPVFWGGPKIGNPPVVTAGTTVNNVASMAICTDTTLCEGDLLSINVMAGGIALLSNGGTTVEYVVGEGCQP